MTAPLLDARGLDKSYTEGGRQRRILQDAALTVSRGEITAILGESGSGKSTLLHLLSGIETPEAGSVAIDGAILSDMSEEERTLFRRRHLGIVFQFFNLLETLTVAENVALPLELCGASASSARSRAAELLARVGLAARLDSFPDRLSGGEQQRVAIARALIHDPLLVLADEPTGNLDETSGREVLSLLEELTRARGGNLILVTHSSTAASVADRTLHMRGGQLHSSPTP